MNYYVKSSFGKISAINTEKEYSEWLLTPGFTTPTEKEVADWTKKRWEYVESLKNNQAAEELKKKRNRNK